MERLRPVRSAVSYLIIALVFVGASWFISSTVRATGAFQSDVRNANGLEGDVLKLQLDEETGLRGYTSTGDRFFLQPYIAARANFPSTIARLRDAVRRVGLSADRLRDVDREQTLNGRWDATVAKPLIAAPHGALAPALQLQGKRLIDDFRAADLRLGDALDQAAQRADRQLAQDVARISVIALAVGLLFASVITVLNRRTEQLAAEVAEQQRQYQAQKQVADTLTSAFLQKKLPAPHYAALHGVYVPAGQHSAVGGDWYDAFELPDGRLFFSIGDVVGHGLDAAVSMSRTRQAIVATALHETDPAEILTRANRSVLVQEGGIVTALCGFIDPANFEIVYATAGHPSPILARPGEEPRVLAHDGMPLGVFANAGYHTFTERGGEGALIVLYTDGVIERSRDIIAGEARLLDAVRDAHAVGDGAAQLIHRRIFGNELPHDDVAILTIRFAAREREGTASVIRSISIPAVGAEDIVV